MNERKMVKAELTPDSETNRRIMPEGLVAVLDAAKQVFGDVRLVRIMVEQGSPEARTIEDGRRGFEKMQN